MLLLLLHLYISDVLGLESTDGRQVTFGLEFHIMPGDLKVKRMRERMIEGEMSLLLLGPLGHMIKDATLLQPPHPK